MSSRESADAPLEHVTHGVDMLRTARSGLRTDLFRALLEIIKHMLLDFKNLTHLKLIRYLSKIFFFSFRNFFNVKKLRYRGSKISK